MKTTLIVIGSVVATLILGGIGLVLLNHPETIPIVGQKEKTYNMEKLMSSVKSKFSTVTVTKVYTSKTDPNGDLGKPGYYYQGAAFVDNRVPDTEEDTADSADWGAEAGGSIEVYHSEGDAKKRVDYLTAFQGNPITDPGAFKQVGNVVIRTSEKLDKSAQDGLINYMTDLIS